MGAHTVPSDLSYLKQLAAAGWDGIAAAKQEMHGRVFTPPLKRSAWAPAALGAALGVAGTRAAGRRNVSTATMAAFAGTLVGLGATLAWTSRKFAAAAARDAARRVNATRDAHWLALNPIDYA